MLAKTAGEIEIGLPDNHLTAGYFTTRAYAAIAGIALEAGNPAVCQQAMTTLVSIVQKCTNPDVE